MHRGFWWETLEERVHLKKTRCKCEDNIITDIVYIKLEGLDCIYLGLNVKNWWVLVNTEM
jgi:hypothetical protein